MELFEIELFICIKMDWYAIKSNQTKMTYFSIICPEKGWYAIKQNNQPTNPMNLWLETHRKGQPDQIKTWGLKYECVFVNFFCPLDRNDNRQL